MNIVTKLFNENFLSRSGLANLTRYKSKRQFLKYERKNVKRRWTTVASNSEDRKLEMDTEQKKDKDRKDREWDRNEKSTAVKRVEQAG